MSGVQMSVSRSPRPRLNYNMLSSVSVANPALGRSLPRILDDVICDRSLTWRTGPYASISKNPYYVTTTRQNCESTLYRPHITDNDNCCVNNTFLHNNGNCCVPNTTLFHTITPIQNMIFTSGFCPC